MAQKICDDRLNRWLQHPVGDPFCRDKPARGHHTGLICSVPHPVGAARFYDIKPPFGSTLLIFPQGNLLKFFIKGDTSARQQESEIRVFPLLGELPKAIDPQLSVCQFCRWQHGPTKWSSPMSLDLIVVTSLRVDIEGESL